MDYEEKIVITKGDLNSTYVSNRLEQEKELKRDFNKAERIPVNRALIYNPIFYTAIAGFLGALICCLVYEPYVDMGAERENPIVLLLMVVSIAPLFEVTIGAADGIVSRNFSRTAITAAVGLGVGIAWSLVCLYIIGDVMRTITTLAYGIFPSLLPKGGDDIANLKLAQIIVFMTSRSAAWTILGAGSALGPGIAIRSKKLILNGLIGGLLGGFVGGFLFDPIGWFIIKAFSISSGAVSRFVGFSILGMISGAFVGIVENLTKDVWVLMKSGPLRGKQFVIYQNPTIIGSSPKSDIYIFKDPKVEPRHAEIRQIGSKFEIFDMNSKSGIYVNTAKVSGSRVLEANDSIIIGDSVLEFQQKEKV